ncbi:1-phosphatidylinositol-3-phosphate 5-kinase FAB1B-like isoform X2 [Andrographis paniculata]|uniref:1-phosphatidylinositol-3-phosphate 5-kinase FAB1B-like isoform X2 n=1 Tax=Andrographis paniculata TaxID=175694 RepID=UPI0021E99A18|nr:1-phosphatidylinositol-3-phosphate 5-kinase FAB1B-like isoform X2 [Andrographis paniculata]
MDDSNRAIPNLVGLIKSWIPRPSEPPPPPFPPPAYVSRDYWMPDYSCRVCYECDARFTVINRRHHCRLCGRIFCAKCTSHWIPRPSPEPGCDPVRVCKHCLYGLQTNPSLMAAASAGNEAHIAGIDRIGSSPSTNSFVSVKSFETSDSSSCTFLSISTPQQTSVMDAAVEAATGSNDLTADVAEAKHILSENGLGIFENRTESDVEEFRMAHFSSSPSPISDIYSYIGRIHYDNFQNESKSCKVHPDGDDLYPEDSETSPPQNYVDSEPHSDDQKQMLQKDFEHDECTPLSSLYAVKDMDSAPVDFENNALLWLPPEPEDEEDDKEAIFIGDDDDDDGIVNPAGEWSYFHDSGVFRSRDKSNVEHKRVMMNVLDSHFRALVSEFLQAENIPAGDENDRESWLEIIMALSWEAAMLLKPDTSTGGQMDPGSYVKVKCLASGRRSESTVVKGVVCKKNVAHRRMSSKFEKARFLILGGALEYQRVSTALSSIDTLLQQEMDHLKMAVAKIDAHRPDVLLVEKSVSRYAQEYLLERDISLVLNLKRSLLERIARCTGGQIVPSIDHLSSAKLGHCEIFRVEKFLEDHGSAGQNGKKLVKTLMYFEGCPKPLGCTILLRGADGDELKKVKRVVQYGVFAAYHLALETSFLADEGATLPVLPLESPITVSFPDTSSKFDRSISTVPGFTIPEYPKVMSNSIPSSDLIDATAISARCNENAGIVDLPVIDKLAADEDVTLIVNDFADSHDVRTLPLVHRDDNEQAMFKEEFSTSSSSSDNQSILVSLSSRCVWKGTVCERAHLFRIKYYGNFDKPLGRYLRDDLFDQNYRCRSCNLPAEAHIQCYTHRQGTLTISVKNIHDNPLPGEKDGKIWMWHRCLKCPRIKNVPPATRRVVMSDAAWGLSFGKFLELSFSNHVAASRVASCGHSLHRDCLRFYGFGELVACFRYASIDVHSVYLPPSKLDFSFENHKWIKKEMNELVARGELLFSEVRDALCHLVDRKCSVENLEVLLLKEKSDFMESIDNILKKEAENYDILEINRLHRQLVFLGYMWDHRLVNLDSEAPVKRVDDNVVADPGVIMKSPPVVSVKSEETSDISCPNAVGAKLDQQPENDDPYCFPDAPELKSIGSEGLSEKVVDMLSDDKEEDSTNLSGTSFMNFYRSMNKNHVGSTQKLDLFRDHRSEYISGFLEAELLGGARLLLPVGVNDTVVPVYDDEPTSIISYALLSPEYHLQVSDKTEKSRDVTDSILAQQSGLYGSFQLFNSFDETMLESYKSFGFGDDAAMSALSAAAAAVTHHSLPPAADSVLRNLHPRVTFSDDGPLGKVKYAVTCYYAKQFESLRKICCPSETDFVRSLSRCKKWGAQGGKSKVFFAKTLDDRFIVKQVTKTELESFIKFGTRYFGYLAESINSGSPSCLAKILGIYQVVSKHVKGGKESKMDMLVMENLLFERNVTRLYDLKGSTRSRYNPDSSGSNKVLLDQNLIEAMPTSPIFVGNKAKRLLERAVWNDTAFLASIDVMDYSLLVGVDEEKHELVLGIIDFMRQYTWDKHLETWVKASGILGGSKNVPPTVISPKQYKTRFRKAMTTYFLMVPDQWSPPVIIPSKSQTDLREAISGDVQTE